MKTRHSTGVRLTDEARLNDLAQFYGILDELEVHLGGARKLVDCSGRMDWPLRGVYLFSEGTERRTHSGDGPRVIRVGTHALVTGSRTTLWNRLSQHRGSARAGGGNHRGSIFRLLVGKALIAKHGYDYPTWGKGSTASRDVRSSERFLEQQVSAIIGDMSFLWLVIEDEAGPDSLRGYIERNTIALLSDYNRVRIDPPSQEWLGHHCDRQRVRQSGLWNSNHVDESYDPAFLDRLGRLVARVGGRS